LQQAHQETGRAWDARLSPDGNRLARRLADVLEGLARMEKWLRQQGRAGLTPSDRRVLTPSFTRLSRDASSVAVLTEDLIGEIHIHERATAQ
jgi:hypothetical protein